MTDGNANTYLWNIATSKVIATLAGTLPAFGPGGAILATASRGGHIDLWKVSKYLG